MLKPGELKIRDDHYRRLSDALDGIKPWIEAATKDYAAQGLSLQRLRWDALRMAKINGDSIRWLCDELYPYLNDNHIDSALRTYFGHPASRTAKAVENA